MKKFACVIFLWIPLLAFSQSTYPKKLVINGDSLVLITQNQAEEINVVYIELDECTATLNSKASDIENLNEINSTLESQIINLEKVIEIKDSVETEQQLQNTHLQNNIEIERKTVKKLKFKKKLFTFVGTAVGVGIGFLIAKLTN